MLDKGNIVKTGIAYANGNIQYSDGTVIRPDGEVLEPLQPGDKMYDMLRKFNTYMDSIDNNVEKLTTNSMYEQNRQVHETINQIMNSNVVNNRNVQPNINIGDIHVTCPGVTEQQVVAHHGDAIDKELDRKFNGFSLYTDQMSRIK